MTSNHPQIEEIYAFLDGALPPAAASAFQQHVTNCQKCQLKVNEAERLFHNIESIPEVSLRNDLSAAVVAELKARQEPTVDLPWWLALQGAIAAGIMAMWAVLQPDRIPSLAGLTDQMDLLVWWGRWALPRLSDVRMALASLPEGVMGSLTAADLSQLWNPLAGIPWSLVIVGSVLLWLIGNSLLLGESPNGDLPWQRTRMRKDSNHG